MKNIPIILRWILTAFILFMAYKETGPWTVICLALITITIEIMVYIKKKEISLEKKFLEKLIKL